MKADDILAIILRFFHDIIGSIIPGALFLIGIGILFPSLNEYWQTIFDLGSSEILWLFIMLSYVSGHGITSIGSWIIIPPINFIMYNLKKLNNLLISKSKHLNFMIFFPPSIESEGEFFENFANDPTIEFFIGRIPLELTKDINKFNAKQKVHFYVISQ